MAVAFLFLLSHSWHLKLRRAALVISPVGHVLVAAREAIYAPLVLFSWLSAEERRAGGRKQRHGALRFLDSTAGGGGDRRRQGRRISR
jgi:hypothetical protein